MKLAYKILGTCIIFLRTYGLSLENSLILLDQQLLALKKVLPRSLPEPPRKTAVEIAQEHVQDKMTEIQEKIRDKKRVTLKDNSNFTIALNEYRANVKPTDQQLQVFAKFEEELRNTLRKQSRAHIEVEEEEEEEQELKLLRDNFSEDLAKLNATISSDKQLAPTEQNEIKEHIRKYKKNKEKIDTFGSLESAVQEIEYKLLQPAQLKTDYNAIFTARDTLSNTQLTAIKKNIQNYNKDKLLVGPLGGNLDRTAQKINFFIILSEDLEKIKTATSKEKSEIQKHVNDYKQLKRQTGSIEKIEELVNKLQRQL